MRAEALRREFAAALHCDEAPDDAAASTGSLVGIEHEFFVLRDGVRVDFTPLLAALDLGRPYLDPADTNAHRLPSGAAVTCDGVEAEIALPPISVAPGFTLDAAHRAEWERGELSHRLGDEFELQGSSTHISINIDADIRVIDAVARLYTATFAPALMLLLDRRVSYGISVRPRPGRLEFCGEYTTGRRLRAALALAAGSVRVCVSAVLGTASPAQPPPPVAVTLDVERHRFGYVVRRGAMGGDLYADGRAALLPLSDGGFITADALLHIAWSSARAALGALGDGEDAHPAQDIVDSDCALPVEEVDTHDGEDCVATAPSPLSLAPAFGRMVQPLRRPGFDMAAVMVTWDAAVLVAAHLRRRRAAFVCIPRAAMDRFLERLDSGALDVTINGYLRRRRRSDRLERHEQTTRPGLYGSLPRRRSLLAREPDAALLSAGAPT
jgi:hypothetical protein